jgi:hypothetical protein
MQHIFGLVHTRILAFTVDVAPSVPGKAVKTPTQPITRNVVLLFRFSKIETSTVTTGPNLHVNLTKARIFPYTNHSQRVSLCEICSRGAQGSRAGLEPEP